MIAMYHLSHLIVESELVGQRAHELVESARLGHEQEARPRRVRDVARAVDERARGSGDHAAADPEGQLAFIRFRS